jgi:hypothetical protein
MDYKLTNLKKKGHKYTFFEKEKKEWRKKRLLARTTIILWYASPYKKKNTTTHSIIQQNGRFGHRMGLMHHQNTANDTYLLAHECDVPISFSNKIIVSQHGNTRISFMNLKNHKKPWWMYTNAPRRILWFLSFLRV